MSDSVGEGSSGCGVFDGQTVTLESCGDTGVGYVCQKQFGNTGLYCNCIDCIYV